jgi:predicted nucleotidyltransferase
MSSILRLINTHFPEAYEAVMEAVKQVGTEAFLIGASAFAVHYAQDGKKPSRGTKDIDFAIYVNDFEQFEQIKTLLKIQGFNQHFEPFTMYHPEWNTAIDIMPFGSLEEKGTIKFLDRPSELVVVGFEQVAQNVEEFTIESQDFRVSTLSGIVLLKSIAFMDRPELRGQDIEDILKICTEYFKLKSNEVYDNHFEFFELFNPNEELYNTYIGAACINKEMRLMIKDAPAIVVEKLLRIVEPSPKRHIISQWTKLLDDDEDGASKVFELLYGEIGG